MDQSVIVRTDTGNKGITDVSLTAGKSNHG